MKHSLSICPIFLCHGLCEAQSVHLSIFVLCNTACVKHSLSILAHGLCEAQSVYLSIFFLCHGLCQAVCPFWATTCVKHSLSIFSLTACVKQSLSIFDQGLCQAVCPFWATYCVKYSLSICPTVSFATAYVKQSIYPFFLCHGLCEAIGLFWATACVKHSLSILGHGLRCYRNKQEERNAHSRVIWRSGPLWKMAFLQRVTRIYYGINVHIK